MKHLFLFQGLAILGGSLVARMPAVQTSYNRTISAARVGQRANEEPVTLISRTVEDVAGIGFGKVVKQGVADEGCTANLAGLDAFNFLGITVMQRNTRVATPDKFAQYDSALIMRKGVIWVQVDKAVVAGTDVTVATATGAINSDAVGAGVVAIPNARFESSTSGAGLAKVRLVG